MGGGLHRFHVDGGYAANGILHDDVEHAFAVGDALLGDAAEINGAEDRAVFRIDDSGILRGMAEDVDPLIEVIEEDTVGTRGPYVDLLEERRGFGVEHRDLWMVAGEAVAGLRIDRRTVAADAGDLAHLVERVEIEDGQACGD